MKKVFLLLTAAMFLFACGNQSNNEATENKDASKEESKDASKEEGKETVSMKAHELMEEGENYVDKTVTVEGTAVHVCDHGGKRMFLKSEDSDERFKVVAGEEIGSFKNEAEGKTFQVKGIVQEKRIDNEYLDNWEKEIKEDMGDDHRVHDGKHGEGETHEDHEMNEDLAKVKNMREEIEESDKDYISIFSLKAKSFEEK